MERQEILNIIEQAFDKQNIEIDEITESTVYNLSVNECICLEQEIEELLYLPVGECDDIIAKSDIISEVIDKLIEIIPK